ncbi:hypothetical protein Afer_0178 [Acidimicrobium ferrooxidans DSM 10331]|uniref:Uncharacterized protein n=1 Tax=Acidimicrobium ferrooxidans (strain DSM 10331 / JCM 15462 / NBRC 103882 / ICP) TaxID=525909 RepID=C7M249_ACIFD|nr:hypothetical protein [Acidimicrobium ferrooxidans]ACU53147.1 hypothetical protein Afer_0178 [Acidimicrobium ferrooxidans DSM 10331]
MEREASCDPVVLASLLAQVDTLEAEVEAFLEVLHAEIEPTRTLPDPRQRVSEGASETRPERAGLA